MKTLRKIGMMVAVAFVALGFTACDDDDDTVTNASFIGTWKIIENINIKSTLTAPDVLIDAEKPATPVSFTFTEEEEKDESGNPTGKLLGKLTYTALSEVIIDTDGDGTPDDADGDGTPDTEIVEAEHTGDFTYTKTSGTENDGSQTSNHLAQLAIDLQATDYYNACAINARYSIEGDVMSMYLKYPLAADRLRKQ